MTQPALPPTLRIDDLQGPEIAKLLQEHLQSMRALSPPESVFALDLDALRQPEITLCTAWDHGALLGCGAIKQLDATHAEVTSMRLRLAICAKGWRPRFWRTCCRWPSSGAAEHLRYPFEKPYRLRIGSLS